MYLPSTLQTILRIREGVFGMAIRLPSSSSKIDFQNELSCRSKNEGRSFFVNTRDDSTDYDGHRSTMLKSLIWGPLHKQLSLFERIPKLRHSRVIEYKVIRLNVLWRNDHNDFNISYENVEGKLQITLLQYAEHQPNDGQSFTQPMPWFFKNLSAIIELWLLA